MQKCIAAAVVFIAASLVEPSPGFADDLAGKVTEGKPELQSIGPIAFGPEGILFVADPKGAAIYAIGIEDRKPVEGAGKFKVEAVNQKLAAALGIEPDQVEIRDLAVHPSSGRAYLSAMRGRGPDAAPVVARVEPSGKVEVLPLDKVKYSVARLPNAPRDDVSQKDRRGGNQRLESITDLAFVEDAVVVAGLSNEEFASTLRSIPFPFKAVDNGAGIEIYHGAHGKFETRSPVRTFVPFKIAGEANLLAAYTCTPLVRLPLSSLKPNAKVKGTTIAELGNRNRPLDMIAYRKDGKDYLLIANNSRGIMKVSTDEIDKAEGITTPVPDGQKKGLSYETIEAWKGVDQLDRLDSGNALVLRRGDAGALVLEALPLP